MVGDGGRRQCSCRFMNQTQGQVVCVRYLRKEGWRIPALIHGVG